jgi:hypothetical protein
MPAETLCSQCRTPNRRGILFCVVCGRRLPRGEFPPDRVDAVAWPGPEVRQLRFTVRPSPLAVSSLVAGVLAWTVLPVLGAAVAVLLALRAQEELRAAYGARGGSRFVRLALWLGGVQLALLLVAGAAMAAVALPALIRSL